MGRELKIKTLLLALMLFVTSCGKEKSEKKVKIIPNTNTAEVTINGQNVLVLPEAQRATLDISFRVQTESGEIIQLNDFVDMHAKKMHLVIFHEDLSHMSHVHPRFVPGEDLFRIELNTEINDDFDNQDNDRVFRKPGLYHAVAEVKSGSAGMLMKKFDILVEGPNIQEVSQESLLSNGLHVSYFDAEGNTLSYGAPYKMLFDYFVAPGDGGELINFRAHIKRFNHETDRYEAIDNFIPWMMGGAHVIVASESGDRIKEKVFQHLHANTPAPNTGVQLNFDEFNRGEMSNGMLFQYWIQFTHCQDGHIVKFIEIDADNRGRFCKTPEEGDDENDLSNNRVLVKAPVTINFQN